MSAKWTQLAKETVFSCAYYSLSHDRYCQPDGAVGSYYYVDILGSTMVVPRRNDGKLVLTRQHRYLMGRSSIEFPAGGLKVGYDPLFNAQQELREEAGLQAAHWQKIGEFAPYNGVSNELCHVFVASDLTEVPAAPEPTEEIEAVIELAPDEISERIASGELWDGMTIASFAIYQRWARKLAG